jgi:hypothetical protein
MNGDRRTSPVTILLMACMAAWLSGTARGEDKLVVRPDAHKTLVNPNCSHCIDESERRAGELTSDDRCLAWIRGKYDGGAIPVRFFLNPYRVISDTYGVFVYDPDAGYMRGYEPSLDFTFHGWRNGVMVMKHKDGTLYSCLSGRAFDGPRKGDQLRPVATIETAWGQWLFRYPGTVAYHMFDKYQPTELPKEASADSISSRLPYKDERAPADLPVIGVAVGDDATAFSIEYLKRQGGLVKGQVSGLPVVVLWYQPTQSAAIYAPEIESRLPRTVDLANDDSTAAAPFIDRKTNSHFDEAGRAVDGPLKDKTLRWLPGVQCKWFAWKADYPQSALVDGRQHAERKTSAANTRRGVIVTADAITPAKIADWARAEQRIIAIALDERTDPIALRAAAKLLAEAKLDLYYWIEVARNPAMADAHPEWMASLGMHDDWHARFPTTPKPKAGEVAKAYPWVPITYREAFEAHRQRIARLLTDRAAQPYKGVLLNDLQAGPASCGCGNLLCRWATDYHVAPTATRLKGDDVAARFLDEVKKLVPEQASVIPIWATECEDSDLPANRAPGGKTSHLCGSVACSKGTCPKAFSKQWSQIAGRERGPIGVLALHRELDRAGELFGTPGEWSGRAVEYLQTIPPRHEAPAASSDRLWVVVQGYGVPESETQTAVAAASKHGPAAVLVATTRIDQSYQPRIVNVKK